MLNRGDNPLTSKCVKCHRRSGDVSVVMSRLEDAGHFESEVVPGGLGAGLRQHTLRFLGETSIVHGVSDD